MCLIFYDQSVHLYYSDDVGPPIVISIVCLLNYSLLPCPTSSHCMATVDPIGKESESLQLLLTFRYLS